MGQKQTKAALDQVLLKDSLLGGPESIRFVLYDWNPAGGVFIDEQKRVRTAGGPRWPGRFAEFDSPKEFDRCMLKVLRAAAKTHIVARPRIAADRISDHLWRLGEQHGPIAQLICGPADEEPVRRRLANGRRLIWVSPLIPKNVIYALGPPEDVGLSPGTKDWQIRGIAVRNPGRVFAFKRAGKWPATP